MLAKAWDTVKSILRREMEHTARLTGTPVADLEQECYLAMHHLLQAPTSVPAYLVTTARNVLRNFMRERAVRPPVQIMVAEERRRAALKEMAEEREAMSPLDVLIAEETARNAVDHPTQYASKRTLYREYGSTSARTLRAVLSAAAGEAVAVLRGDVCTN